MGFVYLFPYFVLVDNAVTLFNCFSGDFCGFRDFQVFDLVIFLSAFLLSVDSFIVEPFILSKTNCRNSLLSQTTKNLQGKLKL